MILFRLQLLPTSIFFYLLELQSLIGMWQLLENLKYNQILNSYSLKSIRIIKTNN
ncbi:hypothetical protein pb186bvf_000401 [Paramecium bursaria]